MAVYACNAGFTELAKLGAGEAADEWTHIALATNKGRIASSTTLDAETVASGLARAAATMSTVTTTVTDDTIQAYKVFTAGATVLVKEAGVFNASSGGDMLMVGALAPEASMVSGDTLTITMKCKIQAAS